MSIEIDGMADAWSRVLDASRADLDADHVVDGTAIRERLRASMARLAQQGSSLTPIRD